MRSGNSRLRGDRVRWAAVLLLCGCATARAEFQRGFIYISSHGGKACTSFGGPAGIVEVNPATGQGRTFAHSDTDPNFCRGGGLRFTPDGSRLLMLDMGYNRILAFDGDGDSEVYLDGSDGLVGPSGQNGLAFDRRGDLFVKSFTSSIRRFPADGSPFSIFANQDDGVSAGGGALDFAPNGDLFFGSDASTAFGILRFSPDGMAFPFDAFPPGSIRSLAVSRLGKVFAIGGGGIIYRYDMNDPASRVVLATGFTLFGGVPRVLSVSSDGSTVYYCDYGTEDLYRIDAQTGETDLLANIPAFADWFWLPTGMAVYAPRVPGDIDADGIIDIIDYALFQGCSTGIFGNIQAPECHYADLDLDGDVDLVDFGLFQSAFDDQ